MAYWWASQNRNYRTVIPQGTLWSRPRINDARPKDRTALFEMEPDDVVFHYGGAHLRAVSRVVSTLVEAKRPEGYRRGERETEDNDDGWLVRVEPFAIDLALHRDDFRNLIRWGEGGPLDINGMPQEKYISRLQEDEAARLLLELDLEIPARSLPGRPHEDWRSGSGLTDSETMAKVRLEQRSLRAFLLNGKSASECGICGRVTPADFLVAGHIVPRSTLSDEDRRNFAAVAMLVCTLGCDALYEHGLIIVDGEGVVRQGRKTDDATLASEVAARAGRVSLAWSNATMSYFELHRGRHRHEP